MTRSRSLRSCPVAAALRDLRGRRDEPLGLQPKDVDLDAARLTIAREHIEAIRRAPRIERKIVAGWRTGALDHLDTGVT